MRWIVVLLFFLPVGAVGEEPTASTARDLEQKCQAADSIHEQKKGDLIQFMNGSYCLGFLRGIAQGLISAARICPGDHWTQGELLHAFTKFIADNPSFENRPDDEIATNAFVRAFPCSQKRSGDGTPQPTASNARVEPAAAI